MHLQQMKSQPVTVGMWFERHRDELGLQLHGDDAGLARRIGERTINRPGLALSGFFEHFAAKRIQVLGSAETAYLAQLSPATRRQRCNELCHHPIPSIIVARGYRTPKELEAAAEKKKIPIFRTRMVTMDFIATATLALEMDFSPAVSVQGSMVDIMGMGILICGASGVGKSECVLGLIERGYALVSDDITHFRLMGQRYLLGKSPRLTQHYMEVRGLGIINILATFGVSAVRTEKQLDLIASLIPWENVTEVDRTGLDEEQFEMLGVQVPHKRIPVRVGRDLARLVEVAALDQKLRVLGENSAGRFNRKLMLEIELNKRRQNSK